MINESNLIPVSQVAAHTRAIKIGKYVFPLAVQTGGGGGMDFYKCAAVYGPHEVPRMRVANAGTTAVNGDYEKTDLTTSSGGEVWKHMEADYYYYDKDGYKCIDGDYSTYGEAALYYSYNGTNWSQGFDYSAEEPTGAEPAPNVSEISVIVDEDVPKTWDGYKSFFANGIYSFEETLTTGLTYDILTPAVDGIYSADVTVEVKRLYDGTDPRIICYFTMDDTGTVAVDKINGIKLSPKGDMTNGVPGIKGTAWSAGTKGSYLSGTQDVFDLPKQFTLNAFMKYTSISTNTYVNATIVAFGAFEASAGFGLWLGKDARIAGYLNRNTDYVYGDTVLQPNVWYMVTMTFDGSVAKTYINGALNTSASYATTVQSNSKIYTFSRGFGGGSTSEAWAGSLDEVSLWNSALTAEEVTALYNSFSA